MRYMYMRAGVVIACLAILPLRGMDAPTRKHLTGWAFIPRLRPIPYAEFNPKKYNGCCAYEVLGIEPKEGDFLVKVCVSDSGSREWFEHMPIRGQVKKFPNWLPLRLLIQMERQGGSLYFENVHGCCDVTLWGEDFYARPDKNFSCRLASRMVLAWDMIHEKGMQKAIEQAVADSAPLASDDQENGWKVVERKRRRR